MLERVYQSEQLAAKRDLSKMLGISVTYLALGWSIEMLGLAPFRDALLGIVCSHFIWSICKSK